MPRVARPRPKPRRPPTSAGPGISYPTLKGGMAMPTPQQPQRASSGMPWTDPVWQPPGSFTGALGGLPWWAQNPGGGSGAGGVPTVPPALGTGGYQEFGPGSQRPDAGPDWSFGEGGNPYGTSRQPGSTEVSANTMGQMLGLTGLPVNGRLLQWYADRYGDANPYDTANAGNTGPVYYGPSRAGGVNDWQFGENFADDWSRESGTIWGGLHPGQGIGGGGGGLSGSGSGFGGGVGGGGAGDPYAGTANPWWWGGPNLR